MKALTILSVCMSVFNSILYQLLPLQSEASQNYNLRRRNHDRQLHQHQGHLSDCNFITRLLYKNSYTKSYCKL